MRLPPTPWSEYETAQFRLAGFGGAAVFLRTSVVPGALFGTEAPLLTMDIGFLSPQSRRHMLARPVDPSLPERLSRFLFAAAEEYHPEQSVAALEDEIAGLVVTVESSADDRVCLDWSLVEDMDAEMREFDGLNFETSRAALVTASQEAVLLGEAGPHLPEGVQF
jgi:hypothetical protein